MARGIRQSSLGVKLLIATIMFKNLRPGAIMEVSEVSHGWDTFTLSRFLLSLTLAIAVTSPPSARGQVLFLPRFQISAIALRKFGIGYFLSWESITLGGFPIDLTYEYIQSIYSGNI